MFKIKWRLRDYSSSRRRVDFYFTKGLTVYVNENLVKLQMFKFKTVFPFNVYYLEKL